MFSKFRIARTTDHLATGTQCRHHRADSRMGDNQFRGIEQGLEISVCQEIELLDRKRTGTRVPVLQAKAANECWLQATGFLDCVYQSPESKLMGADGDKYQNRLPSYSRRESAAAKFGHWTKKWRANRRITRPLREILVTLVKLST